MSPAGVWVLREQRQGSLTPRSADPLPLPARTPPAGGIRLWPSDRTSPEFLGLQFSNLRGLLKGATLNGIPLQRTDYGAAAEAGEAG